MNSSSMPPRILIVDDELAHMRALCDTLRGQAYDTTGLASGEAALALLAVESFDLLLVDLMMPGINGIAVVEAARQIDPDLACIIMTGEGTIASAVQAIPRLAKAAKELYVFQRTPSSIDIRNDKPTDPEWVAKLKPGWQEARRQKNLRGRGEDLQRKAELAVLSREEKVRRQENDNIEYMMRIHRRIEEIVEDKATAEALKPWYMFMCKRPCFDDEYLPAYNRPNTHLVDTHGKGITEINERGVVFEGVTYPVDVLIYATGFEVQKTGIYNQIVGKKGEEINETYKDGLRTLFGVHTHGYPNLFIMGGYQASFQFNLTFMLQTQGDHIAECIKYARDHGHLEIDVSPETEEWWVQEVIAHRGKTSRNADCTPGYYNFEGEFNRRQDGNYNGGFAQYYEHMRGIRGKLDEHFIFS